MRSFLKRHRALLGFGVLLALLPLALPNTYYHDIAIRIALNAIVAVGLNLLVGYTGQISLGHAGFLGLGAYGSAILTSRFDWPPLGALVVTAAAVSVIAYVVARLVLRLRGHYLAMSTLGFGMIVTIALTNEGAWTGGPDGMAVPALSLFGAELSGERTWYAAVAAALFFMVWAAHNLIGAPAGRALQAIHGSEIAARSVGVDVTTMKVRVFTLSATIASIVGSLTAHYIGFITPGVAGFLHSIELVTMVVLGGMASVFGSVVGAAAMTVLPQVLSSFEGWETVVFGAILMLCMMFMPRGAVPTLRSWLSRSAS